MDPIANMLTSIRNAQAVKKEAVVIPYSNVKREIAKILEKEGFLGKVEKREKKEKKGGFAELVIALKYRDDGSGAIQETRRISSPGRRMYIKKEEIRTPKIRSVIRVISTSKGLMTDYRARKEGLGGEIICDAR